MHSPVLQQINPVHEKFVYQRKHEDKVGNQWKQIPDRSPGPPEDNKGIACDEENDRQVRLLEIVFEVMVEGYCRNSI